MSYFSTIAFPPVVQGVDVKFDDFLEASQNIPGFCEALGTTFYLVRKDIDGNLQKMGEARKKLQKDCTLRDLLKYEEDNKTAKNNDSGSTGLLWFRRGLRFVYTIVENMIREEKANSEDSMKPLTKEAYEGTLRPHHNALIAPVIKTCFSALPKRSVLLQSLSNGVPMEQELAEMAATLKNISPMLDVIKTYLIEYRQITDPSKD